MAKYHGGPRQQELCDWLAANGINPHAIPIDADLAINPGPDGGRVIHYEACVLGENEMPVLNERGTDVAVEKRTVPLVVEPPAWWEPFEKPTREQLTARAERVRALHRRNENTGTCEHCSAGDYPNYAVPFPCVTMRALDGEEQ
jgi:hypothetical protein